MNPEKAKAYQKKAELYIVVTEMIEKYIRECEHQDGILFWNNFNSAGEVAEDFIRYYSYEQQ